MGPLGWVVPTVATPAKRPACAEAHGTEGFGCRGTAAPAWLHADSSSAVPMPRSRAEQEQEAGPGRRAMEREND